MALRLRGKEGQGWRKAGEGAGGGQEANIELSRSCSF